jgi:hypothetical protein
MNEEYRETLARHLATAYIALTLGQSFETALRHTEGTRIGDMWFMLADEVIETMRKRGEDENK